MHVNVMNVNPNLVNPKDPVAGFSGMARNMTGLGALMKRGNYRTVFAGKWDAGMATPDHTPRGRGYDEALHYFHHMNDYWGEFFVGGGPDVTCASPSIHSYPAGLPAPVDLWLAAAGQPEGPAHGMNGSQHCFAEPADHSDPDWPHVNTCAEDDGDGSGCPPFPGWPGPQRAGCKYEDELFTEFVLDAVRNHPLAGEGDGETGGEGTEARPGLFVSWCPHIAHTPLQVPKIFLDQFAHVGDWRRRRYLAMVRYLDDAVGQVVDALAARGMLNDTLITFSADNGGPVYGNGTSGGNNWPLRGGKASNWEGGIRVNGWVSGGALPEAMRGTQNAALTTPWDWWKTFADVAGIDDVDDHTAAAAGLPPVDGVSQWPLWSGQTTAPARTTLAVATCTSAAHGFDLWCTSSDDTTLVGGVIVDERATGGGAGSGGGGGGGLWKLIREPVLAMDGWQGPSWPNATSTQFSNQLNRSCGGPKGCLFRLDTDPTEHHDVAQDPANAERVARMGALMRRMNATAFSPDRGRADFEASCGAAHAKWGGFWGPFVE